MIGMEDVIQRHGIKRALQKTKVAVSKISTEDTDGFGYYDLASEDGRKKKTNAALKRNLKRAMSNQEFRDNDPCNCGGSDWYTFGDENCYNELDEVVVFGVNKIIGGISQLMLVSKIHGRNIDGVILKTV